MAERGNARVQIFDDLGACLYVIKSFSWSRDLQIGAELIVDQSGTVEELGLPTGGEIVVFLASFFGHDVQGVRLKIRSQP